VVVADVKLTLACQPAERSDMTDDMFIARVPDGGPERRRPRSVDFNQRGDAPDAPLREDVLHLTHQLARNALTTTMRGDDKAVHVASPSVECSEQGPYDLAVRERQQENCPWAICDSAHTLHVVSRTHARTRVRPELNDRFRVARCGWPEFHGIVMSGVRSRSRPWYGKLDDLVRKPRSLDSKPRQGNRKSKSTRSCAAGIQIQNAVSRFSTGAMSVPGNNGRKTCSPGIEVERREIVKDIQVQVSDIDNFGEWQGAGPSSRVDVAANGDRRRDGAQMFDDAHFTDITSVNDELRSVQCFDSLRAKEAVRVGDHAHNHS
jgi:hypothetical protein